MDLNNLLANGRFVWRYLRDVVETCDHEGRMRPEDIFIAVAWCVLGGCSVLIGVELFRGVHAQAEAPPANMQVIRINPGTNASGTGGWIYKFQDGPNDCYLYQPYWDNKGASLSCVRREPVTR